MGLRSGAELFEHAIVVRAQYAVLSLRWIPESCGALAARAHALNVMGLLELELGRPHAVARGAGVAAETLGSANSGISARIS